MQKIIPNLWFDGQAEEAVNFYIGIFKHSKIGRMLRYGEAASQMAGMPQGSVLTIEFQLEGQDFVAINGGPEFTFNHAISLAVACDSQAELDAIYDKLTAGGEIEPCGWVKDKFGVSWQVVPAMLRDMLHDPNPRKAENVMHALMQMKKLDIKTLQSAYESDTTHSH